MSRAEVFAIHIFKDVVKIIRPNWVLRLEILATVPTESAHFCIICLKLFNEFLWVDQITRIIVSAGWINNSYYSYHLASERKTTNIVTKILAVVTTRPQCNSYKAIKQMASAQCIFSRLFKATLTSDGKLSSRIVISCSLIILC